MNRRKFLSWLGVGTAVAATAPTALLACEDPWCGSIAGEGIIPHDELHGFHYDTVKADTLQIGEYNDYFSFSSFAIAEAIDEHVAFAAKELAYRQGALLNDLVSQARA